MSERVLLIDDDRRLVAVIQIRLEAAGYQVHAAYCGEDGLAMAKQVRPQAILLDVNMPGMDGLEVCRLARADRHLCDTPIIVISAISHELARQAAMQAGASQFLGKPYQATQIMAAIRAAIESGRVSAGSSKG